MNSILALMCTLTVAGTVAAAFNWLAQFLPTAILPTKWRYVINKLAVAFYLVPVVLLMQWIARFLPFHSSNGLHMQQSASVLQHTRGAVFSFGAGRLIPEWTITEAAAFLVISVWVIGVIAFAAWQTYSYRRFLKQLSNTSIAVPLNHAAVKQLHLIKQALGIKSKVKLAYSSSVQGPILVGLWKPAIYLPMESAANIDMSMVLRHELIHLKRKDIWVKMLVLAASALHWFNPFVHLLRKDIHTWSELSCDEEVVKGMSPAERIRYGQTILNVIAESRNTSMKLGASLSGDGKQLKRRLSLMLNVKNLSKKTIFLSASAVAAVAIISTSAAVWASGNTPTVAEQQPASVDKHTASTSVEPAPVPSIAPADKVNEGLAAAAEPAPVPSTVPADEISEGLIAVTEPAPVPSTIPADEISEGLIAAAEPAPVPSTVPADEVSEGLIAAAEPAPVPSTVPADEVSEGLTAVTEPAPAPAPSTALSEAVVKK